MTRSIKIVIIRTARAIRWKKTVIRSKGSGYPPEKNCHPFERLEISVQNDCQPHYCSKLLSAEPFATSLSKNVRDGPFFFDGVGGGGWLENFEINCLQKF